MGCLLGVTVDLDHGVVDIDEHETTPLTHSRLPGMRPEQPGQVGEREQEPGRDGVELADVAEGEHLRNAKLVFRARVVIDARGSGIHRRPGPQPTLGGRVSNTERNV